MLLATDRKIFLAVASSGLAVVALAVLGVTSVRRFALDAEWVAHTHELRGEIQDLSQHIAAAKGDVRGYLLTGDSAFVRRQRAHIAGLDTSFDRLRTLSRDNPDQQQRFALVGDLLAARRAAFDTTIALRDRPTLSRAAMAARLRIGEALSGRIDSVLDAADDAEVHLLAVRAAREKESERRLILVSIAAGIVIAGLTLAFGRSIWLDLTGRARAERALRASEAKFSGIVEMAAEAIVTVDGSQRIVHFNHGAEVIFGYTRAEALGQPIDLLLPVRHAATHSRHLEAFAAGPEVSRRMGDRRQVFGRRKTGEEFPADASISKLTLDGDLLFTAVLRDVTDRVRVERHEHSLAAAGALLAQPLEYEGTLATVAQLPVPAVGAWSVLEIVDENEQGDAFLRRVVSRHPDPLVDAALREWQSVHLDLDSPDASIDVLRRRELLVVPNVTDEWLESRVAGPREREIARDMGMHSLILAPLIAHDRVVAVWTIGSSAEHRFDEHDVALTKALASRAAMVIENARLLRRTQLATAARDQVLSIVSHDLRNPLAAVWMLARRLADGEVDDAGRRDVGSNILASVDWMHRLMQDLLDAASIEAGRLSIEAEPQLLHQVVESVVQSFADRAAAAGVSLNANIGPDLPRVLADPTRIAQVLGNLVGNALKFTPVGGRVDIGALPRTGEMLVWVSDSGCGMPAADIPHVFDRFWQARRTSATRGTGLGLAICQGIIRAHGGRIWADSTPGVGSTFSFTLPLVRAGGPRYEPVSSGADTQTARVHG